MPVCPRLHYRLLTLCPAARQTCRCEADCVCMHAYQQQDARTKCCSTHTHTHTHTHTAKDIHVHAHIHTNVNGYRQTNGGVRPAAKPRYSIPTHSQPRPPPAARLRPPPPHPLHRTLHVRCLLLRRQAREAPASQAPPLPPRSRLRRCVRVCVCACMRASV